MVTSIRILIILAALVAGNMAPSSAAGLKPLTLLNAYLKPSLRGYEPHGYAWSRDDKYVAYLWNDEGWSFGEVWVLDMASGEKWRASDFKSMELANSLEANAELKEEEKKTEEEVIEQVNRRGGAGSPTWGFDGMLYVPYAGDIWKIPAQKPELDKEGNPCFPKPTLFLDLQNWVGSFSISDNGKQLAFEYNNCYWVCDLESGAVREVAQGAGGQGQGSFQWSPDGRFVAFTRVDSSNIRRINMVDFIPENIATWPVNRARPGDMIDRVQIGIADMERAGRQRNEPRMLALGDSKEVYVYDMSWSPSGKYLMAGLLSKDTKAYDLYIAEPATGRTARVWHERDDAWYNRTTQPQWLGDDAIILCSEKDGWGHLYRLDISSWTFPPTGESGKRAAAHNQDQRSSAKGERESNSEPPPDGLAKPFKLALAEPVQLTFGEYEVTQLYVPRDGSNIYFTSSMYGSNRRDVFCMRPDNGTPRRIPAPGLVNTIAAWMPVRGRALNWNERKAVISYSERERGAFHSIFDLPEGVKCRDIVRSHPTGFYSYQWNVPEHIRIKNEKDGELFSARIFRPTNAAGKVKRPVVVYVHGAGYAQTALLSYDWLDAVSMYMAETLGYIVVDIDYRGSSGYGRKWRTDVFLRLGELEVSDAVSAANYVVNAGEGDAGRVGIWGWSYGGFLTNMVMFRAPETFQVGVSVAAVNKWSNYNSWYVSERLGDPNVNNDAYKKSDPIEYADKLEGQLLMIHGIRDDNVLFQDFAQLTQKLLDSGKHVDMMVYPQMGHGPSSDENTVHITEAICGYFLKHFGLGEGATGPNPADSLEAHLLKQKIKKEAAKQKRAFVR